MSAATETRPDATTTVAHLIRFLEKGRVAEDLFAPDLFADLVFPFWRVQADTAESLIAIRQAGHPSPSTVRVVRVDPTDRGFVMEFEERWESLGEHWYCRELARADVVGTTITELSVICSGDWDQAAQDRHAASGRLIRP